MEKAKFIDAFVKTIGHEGGYVNDPDDRGGETYKGIARKFWPNWDGWAIIDFYKSKYGLDGINDRLAKNEGLQLAVEEFYQWNFWTPNKCYEFSQGVAEELFDTAVNQGVKTAAIYFQKALNKLNVNQAIYPDLVVDGKLGNKTISAYSEYMLTAKWESRSYLKLNAWLLQLMNYYQCDKYVRIADKDLSQEKFIPGWLNRV